MSDQVKASELDWLLDSDPAIRWQIFRDLADAPPEVVAAERARVVTEGWGARVLALQGADGQWEGGALFPAQRPPREEGQPWTATAFSLVLLHDFGVDPRSDVVRRRWRRSGSTAAGNTPGSRSSAARSSRASMAWPSRWVPTLARMSMT